MKEFDFLDYHTEYSCSGDVEVKMKKRVCFADAFHKLNKEKLTVNYCIKIYKGSTLRKTNGSNMCFFSRQQIKNHLNQLKSLFPIESRVYDSHDKKKPHFIVEVCLKEVPGIYHKYMLTWLRYLYEYPYNVISLDAYKLKGDPMFRFESIANLFNLVASCSGLLIRGGHCAVHGSPVGFLRRRELVAQLNKTATLNSIYTAVGRRIRRKIPEKLGEFSSRSDIEYWQDMHLFETHRKPVYIEAYKDQLNKKKK